MIICLKSISEECLSFLWALGGALGRHLGTRVLRGHLGTQRALRHSEDTQGAFGHLGQSSNWALRHSGTFRCFVDTLRPKTSMLNKISKFREIFNYKHLNDWVFSQTRIFPYFLKKAVLRNGKIVWKHGPHRPFYAFMLRTKLY